MASPRLPPSLDVEELAPSRSTVRPPDIRNLVCLMSEANHLCGAPRIHGELLKLGIDISQATVAKNSAGRRPPSQTWRTFLANHVDQIMAADFFVARRRRTACCSCS